MSKYIALILSVLTLVAADCGRDNTTPHPVSLPRIVTYSNKVTPPVPVPADSPLNKQPSAREKAFTEERNAFFERLQGNDTVANYSHNGMSNHPTYITSVKALKKRYTDLPLPQKVEGEIVAYLNKKQQANRVNPKHDAVYEKKYEAIIKQGLIRIFHPEKYVKQYTYDDGLGRNSGYLLEGSSAAELLTLDWLAACDTLEFRDESGKVVTVEEKKDAVLYALFSIQRAYNIDEESDPYLINPNKPACGGGAINRIVSALNHLHPDVYIELGSIQKAIDVCMNAANSYYRLDAEDADKEAAVKYVHEGSDAPEDKAGFARYVEGLKVGLRGNLDYSFSDDKIVNGDIKEQLIEKAHLYPIPRPGER